MKTKQTTEELRQEVEEWIFSHYISNPYKTKKWSRKKLKEFRATIMVSLSKLEEK